MILDLVADLALDLLPADLALDLRIAFVDICLLLALALSAFKETQAIK